MIFFFNIIGMFCSNQIHEDHFDDHSSELLQPSWNIMPMPEKWIRSFGQFLVQWWNSFNRRIWIFEDYRKLDQNIWISRKSQAKLWCWISWIRYRQYWYIKVPSISLSNNPNHQICRYFLMVKIQIFYWESHTNLSHLPFMS